MNSPLKLLNFAPGIWRALMNDLRERGDGARESGAFLLTEANDPMNRVTAWLPYDELWPEALTFAYVRLETEAFARLWSWCEVQQVRVIADVHTHPFGPRQSRSDRAHPMMAFGGHVALIVPRYAEGEPLPGDVSVNVYAGAGKWSSYLGEDASKRIDAP